MAQSDVLLEELTLLSRDFFRLISDCLTAHADLAEISPTQFRALAFLVQRGPHNASDLAETLAVGRPAATKLVDRLVRSGMIRREPHPTDRRQVILEATGEGFEVVQAVQRCRKRRLAAVLAAIDPAARKALAKALPALTDALMAAAVEAPEPASATPVKRPSKTQKRQR